MDTAMVILRMGMVTAQVTVAIPITDILITDILITDILLTDTVTAQVMVTVADMGMVRILTTLNILLFTIPIATTAMVRDMDTVQDTDTAPDTVMDLIPLTDTDMVADSDMDMGTTQATVLTTQFFTSPLSCDSKAFSFKLFYKSCTVKI